MNFAEKYHGVDLKRIDLETIKTREEGVWLLSELDKIIGDIEESLDFALSGNAPINEPWWIKTRRALKGAKSTRNNLTWTMGKLPRNPSTLRRERLFIVEAREVCGHELYRMIWDRVFEKHPSLKKEAI